MKLTQKEKEFIANEYHIHQDFSEIAFDTGLTVQAVKRALAEMQVITLSWHKTPIEHALLTLLSQNNIQSVTDLMKYKLVERS